MTELDPSAPVPHADAQAPPPELPPDSEQEPEPEPEDPSTFLERLKSFDFDKGDIVTAATVVGSGLAIAAGILAVRQRGNRVRSGGEDLAITVDPAQYMKGFASLVRLKDGMAASFPVSQEAVDNLHGKGKLKDVAATAVYIMTPGGETEFPLRDDDEPQKIARYRQVTKWGAGVLRSALTAMTKDSEPQPNEKSSD